MATQLADTAAELSETGNDNDQAQIEAPRDFEAEAKLHGWTPEADFKGDKSRFVDAETFMKRADEMMPLLKATTARQKREIEDLKKMIKRSADHFSKVEERATAAALAQLIARQEKAVADGNLEAHRAVGAEIEKLREDIAPAGPSREDAAEAWDAFRDANPWYDKANLAAATETEINARLYADRMCDKHIAKTQDMAPEAFFAMIRDLVVEKYPALTAKAPRQKPPSDVSGTTPGRSSASGKTFSDLPVDIQQMADKWVKNGVIKDRAAYVKTFDWSSLK